MPLKPLLGAIAVSVAFTPLLPSPAQAIAAHPVKPKPGRANQSNRIYRAPYNLNDCRSATGLIVLPNGTCYNLSYLTKLGNSRSGMVTATEQLNEAAALKTSTNTAISITRSITDDVALTRTYQNNPTESEKEALNRNLSNAAKGYVEARQQNQSVEEYAFKRQTVMLNRISGALISPPEYSYR